MSDVKHGVIAIYLKRSDILNDAERNRVRSRMQRLYPEWHVVVNAYVSSKENIEISRIDRKPVNPSMHQHVEIDLEAAIRAAK